MKEHNKFGLKKQKQIPFEENKNQSGAACNWRVCDISRSVQSVHILSNALLGTTVSVLVSDEPDTLAYYVSRNSFS